MSIMEADIVTPQISQVVAIQKGWEKHISILKPTRNPKDEEDARNYLYASSRRECVKRMVHECVNPSYFPDFDIEAKARFVRGEQREIDLRQALERVGQLTSPAFSVIGQQERISIYDRKQRKVISGKIDGAIQWESKVQWPFEMKSWSPFLTDSISRFEDVLESPWTRSGAFQLLSYLFAKEQPYGLLVLDRPGIPRLILVDLFKHIQLMEDFVRDAETVRDHIDAGTLPDFSKDATVCKRCPLMGGQCNPPIKHAGAKFIVDDETLMMIEEHEGLYDGAKRYEKIHKKLKEIVEPLVTQTARKDSPDKIIAGEFVIDAYRGKNTSTVFPSKEEEKAFKDKYQVSTPDGKFFFDVTHVDRGE